MVSLLNLWVWMVGMTWFSFNWYKIMFLPAPERPSITMCVPGPRVGWTGVVNVFEMRVFSELSIAVKKRGGEEESDVVDAFVLCD